MGKTGASGACGASGEPCGGPDLDAELGQGQEMGPTLEQEMGLALEQETGPGLG